MVAPSPRRPRSDCAGTPPWAVLAGGVVLAAGAVGAYDRTFSVPLLFDDIPAIVNNPSIRHWNTAFWPPLNTSASGRPILNLSLTVNYAISGTAVWSYHALNLLIHVLAGLTLFGIVRRTLLGWSALSPTRWATPFADKRVADPPSPGFGGLPNALHPNCLAFAVALLWTVHPLQTESVTYIIQRAESLMGLFYLLTLYCFIRGVERVFPHALGGIAGRTSALGTTPSTPVGGDPFLLSLSILACLFGMATKEVMVSAPVILFLYDRTFVTGSFQAAWRSRWRVYLGLAATWLILPWLVISSHGRNGDSGFGSGISWWRYALTQFPAILRYLKLSVWPHPLVFDYGTEWVTNPWKVLPAATAVVALAVATARTFFRRSTKSGSLLLHEGFGREFGGQALGFAGAWFFAVLAPTSLIPGNRQTAAEHRMYLALIPVVVLGVGLIFRRMGRGALPFCLVLAAVLSTVTWQRNRDYRSVLDLWSDTVAKNPANPQAQDNLGNALASVPGRLNDAIPHFEAALQLKPDYAEAHNNLGNAWMGTPGRTHDAVVQYEAALRLKPDLAETRNNLGNALNLEGRMPEAIAQYEAALRLKPDYPEAHLDLAIALLNTPGRTQEAVAHLETALRLQPGMAAAKEILASLQAAPP